MGRFRRIQLSSLIGRLGGRLWCAGLLVLLVATEGVWANPQAPADPEVDRLTASAEAGDAAAQLKLGMHYYEGTGRRNPPDYDEAMKWFRRAADQGNAEAQDRVGMMYYQGKGMPRDYAEAAHWYLLAAQGGNDHAQRQLVQMYQGGVGVPRDIRESKKWSRLVNERHPDKTAPRIRMWFAGGLLATLGFASGLLALQRKALTGWQRLVVGLFVHVAGIALVLDSLTTYGFWIVFPHCSHNYLATACTQIADPHTRKIVNEIGDWAMVNLIFRFMAIFGLALDVLAVWYLVYVWRLFFRRSPRPARPGIVPSSQTGSGRRLIAGQ